METSWKHTLHKYHLFRTTIAIASATKTAELTKEKQQKKKQKKKENNNKKMLNSYKMDFRVMQMIMRNIVNLWWVVFEFGFCIFVQRTLGGTKGHHPLTAKCFACSRLILLPQCIFIYGPLSFNSLFLTVCCECFFCCWLPGFFYSAPLRFRCVCGRSTS